MFKNKTISGRNNIAGSNIASLRKASEPKLPSAVWQIACSWKV